VTRADAKLRQSQALLFIQLHSLAQMDGVCGVQATEGSKMMKNWLKGLQNWLNFSKFVNGTK
jgi:hypothetical protein